MDQTKKTIYFENLDAMRFFCFLMVYLFHSFHTENIALKEDSWFSFLTKRLWENGNLGVNFFFVLSGFLITYLLLIEREKYNKIHIGKFWMRRILRIWPLYFLCVFFGFEIFPLLKSAMGQNPEETASLLHFLTFTSNFDMIYNGSPDASNLAVLWSIAIEEQFYIIWPVLLSLLPAKRYWIIFIGIILASLTFRFFHQNYTMNEYHTLSCISDMSVGGLGAWLIYSKNSFSNFITNLSKTSISSIYIIFFILFFFRKEISGFNTFLSVSERLICSIPIVLIIMEQTFSKNSLFKLGKFKRLTIWGRYTYGMYCLHFIAILITLNAFKFFGVEDTFFKVVVLDFSIALVLTIIISIFSFKYYESFFLKLKSKFALVKSGVKI